MTPQQIVVDSLHLFDLFVTLLNVSIMPGAESALLKPDSRAESGLGSSTFTASSPQVMPENRYLHHRLLRRDRSINIEFFIVFRFSTLIRMPPWHLRTGGQAPQDQPGAAKVWLRDAGAECLRPMRESPMNCSPARAARWAV